MSEQPEAAAMPNTKSPLSPRRVPAPRWAVLALALAAAAPALSPAPVQAQARGEDAGRFSSAEGPTRRINLGVGKSIIIDLPADASEIFVADPKVANAIVRSTRRIYVIAAQSGQTTIYAMDKDGRRIAVYELSVGRDVGELGAILKAALPSANIVARTVNDSIILTGDVDSAGDIQIAMDISKGFVQTIKGTDGSSGTVINAMSLRGRDQVMLKVTIAEMQRTIAKQLGVTGAIAKGGWGSISLPNAFGVNGGPLAPAGSTAGVTSGATIGALGVSTLAAQIQAYETNGVARVLAEPTVTAVSGESAKFSVGGEIPIGGGTTCTGGVCTVTPSFKNVGVSLNFIPVVLAGGRILLRVATEVDEVDPSINVNGNPGFKTRKNETSVELPSGGSIVSAGLIETKSASAIQGLPGLMNLPVLGALFRSRDFQRQETELVIIVTPYIAKPNDPSKLARPTDGFADASDPQGSFLGRVNQIYSSPANPQIVDRFRGGFIAD
jgi:pilus assembly protein CpaC